MEELTLEHQVTLHLELSIMTWVLSGPPNHTGPAAVSPLMEMVIGMGPEMDQRA